MANICEFLSKDGNNTPEKARKSRQMLFHDKTAYVRGLRYRWDPSVSMNQVRQFAHFMPPCFRILLLPRKVFTVTNKKWPPSPPITTPWPSLWPPIRESVRKISRLPRDTNNWHVCRFHFFFRIVMLSQTCCLMAFWKTLIEDAIVLGSWAFPKMT